MLFHREDVHDFSSMKAHSPVANRARCRLVQLIQAGRGVAALSGVGVQFVMLIFMSSGVSPTADEYTIPLAVASVEAFAAKLTYTSSSKSSASKPVRSSVFDVQRSTAWKCVSQSAELQTQLGGDSWIKPQSWSPLAEALLTQREAV